MWFPYFPKYKDSKFKFELSHIELIPSHTVGPEPPLAADFKRIISVLPDDGRRRIGFFVTSLLGLRGNQSVQESVEALTERRNHNDNRIKQLEGQVDQLKQAKFKAEQVTRTRPTLKGSL